MQRASTPQLPRQDPAPTTLATTRTRTRPGTRTTGARNRPRNPTHPEHALEPQANLNRSQKAVSHGRRPRACLQSSTNMPTCREPIRYYSHLNTGDALLVIPQDNATTPKLRVSSRSTSHTSAITVWLSGERRRRGCCLAPRKSHAAERSPLQPLVGELEDEPIPKTKVHSSSFWAQPDYRRGAWRGRLGVCIIVLTMGLCYTYDH